VRKLTLREQLVRKCWEVYARHGPSGEGTLKVDELAEELAQDALHVHHALTEMEKSGLLKPARALDPNEYRLVHRPPGVMPPDLAGEYLELLAAVVEYLGKNHRQGRRDLRLEPEEVAREVAADPRRIELALSDLYSAGIIEKSRTGTPHYRLARRPPADVRNW